MKNIIDIGFISVEAVSLQTFGFNLDRRSLRKVSELCSQAGLQVTVSKRMNINEALRVEFAAASV